MSTPIEQLHRSLRPNFRGELLRAEDAGYPQARIIWNGMVARSPGLIARCLDAADVQAAVRVASAAGVLTAIRCGGHSLAGFGSCDGGPVIDLSPMRQVTVDAANRRARFGGGSLLGTVDIATQAVGLAFPAGVVSHTGAAGLVLGGGTGWLNRLHGLSCDNVKGFSVVLADGSLVHANASENADLFWALRGGGGNFGVVTEFEVRLHPLTTVLFGTAMYVGDDIARILQRWRDFMPEAPDNLRWCISLTTAPETTNIPAHVRGRPVASATAMWAGDLDEGHLWVDRVLSFCNPVSRTKEVIPFLKLQTKADAEFPHGRRYYTKSGYLNSFSDQTIHSMVEALATIPSPANQIELAYLGGAVARVDANETAFGDRSSPFIVNLLGSWQRPEDDADNVAWVRNLFMALRPAMSPGAYVNFMSGDEDDRVAEVYRERWDRLVEVKSKYDPENFFRLNLNIPPRKKAHANT
jgi:hypothetical protein